MALSREPENVIIARNGSVLGKKTIVKSDHFPGCQNKRLLPQVEGAPNYRQVGSLPVFGVAIPTVDGIRRVLELIGCGKNAGQRVLWHNLREEPVLYINGRPFVLREIEHPFTNLEYTGINRARVEQMEARLKEDVLRESSRYQNKIMVSDELPDGQMIDQWEPISQGSVQTPLEVYEMLHAEGVLVDYERVPITDEKSPKERDFDLLVHRLSQAEKGTAFVFNCQMGRGRTTTGMVIATLIHLRRTGSTGIPRTSSTGLVHDLTAEAMVQVPDSEEACRRGEYTVIRSLVRVLEGGAESKREVDQVIDKCSAMQNLREAIAGYRNSIQRQADEKKREAALSYFVEYLERYYFLICFAVYIHTDQSALLPERLPGQGSFQQWMRARPELYSILRRLLRRDPMGALAYGSNPAGTIHASSETGTSRPRSMETVVASRRGQVLGRQTVLKSDHCPGCQSVNLRDNLVDGAPNFRKVDGFPVYGVANPTVDGIRAVLQRVVGSGVGTRQVLWHNMREEPVVYINGKPFVLREVERPFKNMLEYSGIDRERVEQMEARLKEDVLREAAQYEGAIMVNHETDDGQVFDAWEPVESETVKTPLEVYKSLESEGLPVHYGRVPITDGKAPKSSDFGTLAERLVAAPSNTAFVFNCQMGRGRTTTGTVIACLVQLRSQFGRPLRMNRPTASEEAVTNASSGSGDDGGVDSPRENRSVAIVKKPGFVLDDIPIVRKITRLLENGDECRKVLDAVIDLCALMQNIRQAVLQYRRAFNQQNLEPHVRRAALNRGVEYLERYFMLIAFAAYLGSPAFDGYCEGNRRNSVTFKQWLKKRPEVNQMKWSMRLRPARVFAINEDLKNSGEVNEGNHVMEAVVKARIGSVLGKGTILKMYFFPGQKTSSNREELSGAPYTWKVESMSVHSTSTPTVEGARALLSSSKVHPRDGIRTRRAVITDLREEMLVYIHGSPFVLRELDQPVSTLKHAGITGPAVEQLESRLKEDILTEASRTGGRILLHREEFMEGTNHSDVVGYWETVQPADVQTSAEVYESLKADGYNIDHKRIPFTRDRAALATDVDAIQSRIATAGDGNVDYYYISHTGFGGVAYAMAITCLRLQAATLSVHLAPSSSAGINLAKESSPGEVGEISRPSDNAEAYRRGDYRDILSLTRVLVHGPASKIETDAVIERCQGAGNILEDLFFYKRQLDSCEPGDEDRRLFLEDMGIKALRRYFYLIAFRSYLHQRSAASSSTGSHVAFASWMLARPELGHLCDNLKLD